MIDRPNSTGQVPPAVMAGRGKVKVPLARTTFPDICCGCGENVAPGHRIEMHVPSWIMMVTSKGEYCEVPIPCCAACSKQNWLKKMMGFLAVQCSLIVLLTLIPVIFFPEIKFLNALTVSAIISFVFVTLTWNFGGRLFSLFHATYNGFSGYVTFFFRRHEYAQVVCDHANNS